MASLLIGLSFMCLTLTGQTAVRNEAQAVRPFEETRPGKAELREPGERPASGNVQLRADARAWPDSTVTFSAAGERQGKAVDTYDAAGNQTLYEYYTWEGDAWINSSKAVYAYDDAGHQTLYEYYSWEDGTWVNSSKTAYTYDADGHQTSYESYRWENDQWTGNSKSTYAYDSKGVQILWGQYNWVNNTWVKSREEHYDRKTADSKVYIDVSVYYNEDGSRWGNALFVTGSGLNWTWIKREEQKMEYKATYDTNGNLTRVETTALENGKRVPLERYVLKYSNNNPVSIEVYRYNGNDIGQMTYKATNTYDAEGNLTLSEAYSWEGDPAKWVGLNRQVSTYDANGKELSSEYYNWDTSAGGWIGSSKSASTYDANGRELSWEYYRWDTSSGAWKGNSKYTYEERDEYGDIILSRDWSWENSGWEWESYTVYYPGGYDPVGTERIGGAEPSVYVHGGMLHLRTVGAERISVYIPNGAKVYESTVPAGTTTVSAERLPKGVLIVRGSSGWVKKVVK
ncbi:MAG: DUF3836 domain-containing protein [Tannerella sp.]|nr:DUF3836 domain-containing protein [Tannerella sp.]